MRLQATKLSPRAPIFAQCVWRREKNPLGARPHPLNRQPIEQPRAYVGPAPLKQSARLNAIQNQDGNAPSHKVNCGRMKLHVNSCHTCAHYLLKHCISIIEWHVRVHVYVC